MTWNIECNHFIFRPVSFCILRCTKQDQTSSASSTFTRQTLSRWVCWFGRWWWLWGGCEFVRMRWFWWHWCSVGKFCAMLMWFLCSLGPDGEWCNMISIYQANFLLHSLQSTGTQAIFLDCLSLFHQLFSHFHQITKSPTRNNFTQGSRQTKCVRKGQFMDLRKSISNPRKGTWN